MYENTTEIITLDSRERRSRQPFFIELSQAEGSNTLRMLTKWYDAGGFRAGTAQGFNEQFMDVLHRLGQLVVEQRSLKLDKRECAAFLNETAEIGAAAYSARFLEDVRHALLEYETAYADRGISLTLTIPDALSVFWEMIYTGTIHESENDSPERFWGLRYPLGRMHWGPHPHDEIYFHGGALPILDDELSHAHHDKESLEMYLAELAGELGIDLGIGDLQELLPEEQVAAALLALFCSVGFNYGIVHFACHLFTPPGSSAAQAYLRFTTRRRQWKLTLRKLQAMTASGTFSTCHPLIFLNGCASSTQGYFDEMLSFPFGFMSLGAGSVIATACPVPDAFASAFCDEFYRRMLDRSQLNDTNFESTVAAVLLETRWHFLREFNNPLGLAYGLYGMSKLKLLATKRTRLMTALVGPTSLEDNKSSVGWE